jgi:serine phosphatase RsbU (regulator of sigma subunit)
VRIVFPEVLGMMLMLDPTSTDALRALSTSSAVFNGVHIRTRVIPGRGPTYGSDWCHAFAVTQNIYGLSIGDVCGRSVTTFESMVFIRQAIHEASLGKLNPAQILAQVNRILYRQSPVVRASTIVAFFDTRERKLLYANAGHPPLLIVNSNRASFLENAEPNLALGIDPDLMPQIHEVNVAADTLLVFYTDGVSENGRDAVQGSIQLCAAARLARDFPELPPTTTIEAMTVPTGLNFDDAAILTVRTPRLPVTERNSTAQTNGVFPN